MLGTGCAAPAADACNAQLGASSSMLDGEPTTIPTFAEAFAVQEVVEAILSQPDES